MYKFRIVIASQAVPLYKYRNIKRKIHSCNANIFCLSDCVSCFVSCNKYFKLMTTFQKSKHVALNTYLVVLTV